MSDKMLKVVLLIGFTYSAVMLITALYPIMQVYHSLVDGALEMSALMDTLSK